MKMQITFKSGAQILVDVEELTTSRNPLTNALVSLEWTTPEVWSAKLHTLDIDEIAAVVVLHDEEPPSV